MLFFPSIHPSIHPFIHSFMHVCIRSLHLSLSSFLSVIRVQVKGTAEDICRSKRALQAAKERRWQLGEWRKALEAERSKGEEASGLGLGLDLPLGLGVDSRKEKEQSASAARAARGNLRQRKAPLSKSDVIPESPISAVSSSSSSSLSSCLSPKAMNEERSTETVFASPVGEKERGKGGLALSLSSALQSSRPLPRRRIRCGLSRPRRRYRSHQSVCKRNGDGQCNEEEGGEEEREEG